MCPKVSKKPKKTPKGVRRIKSFHRGEQNKDIV